MLPAATAPKPPSCCDLGRVHPNPFCSKLKPSFNGSQHRGRSGDRRLPQAYAAAAGRLPVRASADHPASDALVVAPLLAAPWNLEGPQVEGEASPKRKFKAYPIGYFHIDIAEVRTAEGKLYLLVAIDRTSKFAFVELRETVSRRDAADFLRRLIEAVPYKVHTVLTDNGTHFTDPAGNSRSPVEIEGDDRRAEALPSACLRICLRHQ